MGGGVGGVGGVVRTLAISTAQISSLFTHFGDEGDREGMGLYVWLRLVCLGKEDPLVRTAGVIGTSKRERGRGAKRREMRDERGNAERREEKRREAKRSTNYGKSFSFSVGVILFKLFNP